MEGARNEVLSKLALSLKISHQPQVSMYIYRYIDDLPSSAGLHRVTHANGRAWPQCREIDRLYS
jgi:hypothetical protein